MTWIWPNSAAPWLAQNHMNYKRKEEDSCRMKRAELPVELQLDLLCKEVDEDYL